MKTKSIEGVTYYPFRVRFRLADGRRRVWIRYAPALQYAYESLNREWSARFEPSELMPGSCTVRAV
jgi:hypothetical protein